jgi:hypothetical protein
MMMMMMMMLKFNIPCVLFWLTVQEALLEGPGVMKRLADRDGFEASVEPDGEKRS